MNLSHNLLASLALFPLSLGACVVDDSLELGSVQIGAITAPVGEPQLRDRPGASYVFLAHVYEQELIDKVAF